MLAAIRRLYSGPEAIYRTRITQSFSVSYITWTRQELLLKSNTRTEEKIYSERQPRISIKNRSCCTKIKLIIFSSLILLSLIFAFIFLCYFGWVQWGSVSPDMLFHCFLSSHPFQNYYLKPWTIYCIWTVWEMTYLLVLILFHPPLI